MCPEQLPSSPPADLDTQALDWFVRRGGSLTTQEEGAFQIWLAAYPAHRQAYARWQGDWDTLDALPVEGVALLRRNLAIEVAAQADAAQAQTIRQTPVSPRSASSPASRPASLGPRAWWRGLARLAPSAALATVLLSVSGGSYLGWRHWQAQPLYTQSFATLRGQQIDVQLPDGSRLRLDTATRVDVALYRHRREVRLPEGQAVFKVQGDAARPFDVLAGPVRVTVVGTQFSVRHTPGIPGDGGVQVAVAEGRVRVASTAVGAPTASSQATVTVELTAGQQVAATSAGLLNAVSRVASEGIAPWRDGRISFDNVPLAQALAEFERYGATGMVVNDPQVAALRLTGTFDPRRLDNFTRVLPQVMPVSLRTSDGTTYILPRNER